MLNLICRGAKGDIPGISPVLAPLLIARGADTYEKAQAFLHPSEGDLNDPFLMPDMHAACTLIRTAIARRIPIAVYGDYDCDGVCATAILLETLRSLGADVRSYIPSRKEEGYGLNEAAVQRLAEHCGLMITVDCGVTAVKEITLAKSLGMQVILTDHHTMPDQMPPADAVLHPQLGGYPCAQLCGAGVAYKLSCALTGKNVLPSLELAGLATIADMVPLLGENRALAALGLRAMRKTQRPGLRALMQTAGMKEDAEIGGMQAGFLLAPRINACGRMDTADIALNLLSTKNAARAAALAAETDTLNARRKTIEQRILEEAESQVRAMDLCSLRAIVVQGEGWESGVVGLVAGRLAERYGYPTVALSQDGDVCVGSARSASGVDLYQALSTCADLFIRFGGHKQAAGLTIRTEDTENLRMRLSRAVEAQLAGRIPMPESVYDAEITLPEITLDMIDELRQLEPFGMGNPAPVYLLRQAEVLSARAVGATGAHLKLTLSQNGTLMDGIAFQMGDRAGILQGETEMVITPEQNSFRGKVTPQCRVQALGRASAHFSPRPQEEALALLQEFDRFCRIDKACPQPQPVDADSLQAEPQGTLLLCRTADTANALSARFADLDAQQDGGEEPRAYSTVWLCTRLKCKGPYRKIVLCDGLLCPQEAAALAALYPQAALFAMPQSAALRARIADLRFDIDTLRNLYRALRSGEKINTSDPRECAMAYVLQSMGLLTLQPAVQLLPMRKCSPTDDPLYRLILNGGNENHGNCL